MEEENNELSKEKNGGNTPSKVFSANKLLERPYDDAYLLQCTNVLKKEKEKEKSLNKNSVVIFRLGNELLAISTVVFVEAFECRTIHRIPHRTNPVLMGTVNFRGRLLLCVALHNLLEIENEELKYSTSSNYLHMLAVNKDYNQWIFPVTEVLEAFYIDFSALENVPATVSLSGVNYLMGIFKWNEKNVALLDEELLFHSLQRNAL